MGNEEMIGFTGWIGLFGHKDCEVDGTKIVVYSHPKWSENNIPEYFKKNNFKFHTIIDLSKVPLSAVYKHETKKEDWKNG